MIARPYVSKAGVTDTVTVRVLVSWLVSQSKGGHKDRKPRIRGQHTDAGREDRGQEDHREELPYNIELSDILGRSRMNEIATNRLSDSPSHHAKRWTRVKGKFKKTLTEKRTRFS
uniref:Uncharacterized protein n=1 Tax=Timema monikensis TaxID=170555 RepID=A0A7R9EAF4_9NEOP|nr:unnamed protein product [Timema monikensis]